MRLSRRVRHRARKIAGMHQMIELHPRPDTLGVLGLPAIPYPVALPVFQAAVANDAELPLGDMLHGLQLRAAHGEDWQRLEPAMARLSELIAGDDARTHVTVAGEGWALEIGPVRAHADLVALRRAGTLLAVLADGGDGALRLSAFRPLDGAAIALVLDLARTGGAGPWARTCDAAAACQAVVDDATPLLVRHPAGAPDPRAEGPDAAVARTPACVAAELCTWHMQRARA